MDATYEPPLALTIIGTIFIGLALLVSLWIAADIVVRRGWNTMMAIMIPVYVLNALYLAPITLWTYLNWGRPAKPAKTKKEDVREQGAKEGNVEKGGMHDHAHMNHAAQEEQEKKMEMGDHAGHEMNHDMHGMNHEGHHMDHGEHEMHHEGHEMHAHEGHAMGHEGHEAHHEHETNHAGHEMHDHSGHDMKHDEHADHAGHEMSNQEGHDMSAHAGHDMLKDKAVDTTVHVGPIDHNAMQHPGHDMGDHAGHDMSKHAGHDMSAYSGHDMAHGGHDMSGHTHMHMMDDRPMFATITVAVCHCGAGCLLGDIVGEWLVWGTGASINGRSIWVEWLVDYAFALLFGIVFQYWSIAPMSGEYGPRTLRRAAKADFLSLTCFEIGLFGWMAIFQLGIWGGRLGMDNVVYWWMMQVGMFLGHWTAFPVNWWLITNGIKEPCA
ncbi:hypothetical protein CALVIDRAFT_536647 [Calocera viscosa TUFC12733]|uniref:DUF4396 domain-containing protein n=1 Tax=Calocera viscosa (strain TUFC12733) TaxID=1330018 RepID=A0A167MYH8_CALVF|nr:hypothetical protein CALVIDRAFT_536647 [Calocera viscosa TUFC12733]